MDVHLGDVLRLRKPHPCGTDLWDVVRLGADLGLRCQGCQRRVLMPRGDVERQVKEWIKAEPPGPLQH
ncbi:MAG: DUF951 domain-containing protein [Chloroflexi bacterium]|nr:DUF951 domain-containing protein [Chloroflexota bacterium]